MPVSQIFLVSDDPDRYEEHVSELCRMFCRWVWTDVFHMVSYPVAMGLGRKTAEVKCQSHHILSSPNVNFSHLNEVVIDGFFIVK